MSLQKKAGFTLLELLIIIVIAGILATNAVPKMTTVGPKQRFFKNSVLEMLRYVRQTAIVRPVLATSQEMYTQVYLNTTTTPAQFEIYTCGYLTNIGADPAACLPIYNFFDLNGTLANPAHILPLPTNSVVVPSANSNPINFDVHGYVYDNTQLSPYPAKPAVGSTPIVYTFDSNSTIVVVQSTGRIYAP